MPRICFYRKHHFFHLLGKWNVFINGENRLSLLPNKIAEIELEENEYEIPIKSGFLKSNTINIKVNNEDKIYFLMFIDMPYWKKIPFIFLFFYFKKGGLVKVLKLNESDFLKTMENQEGLVWVN
jgi:hypothetical protein